MSLVSVLIGEMEKRWYGYVYRRDDEQRVKNAQLLKMRVKQRGETWEVVDKDMPYWELNSGDANSSQIFL